MHLLTIHKARRPSSRSSAVRSPQQAQRRAVHRRTAAPRVKLRAEPVRGTATRPSGLRVAGRRQRAWSGVAAASLPRPRRAGDLLLQRLRQRGRHAWAARSHRPPAAAQPASQTDISAFSCGARARLPRLRRRHKRSALVPSQRVAPRQQDTARAPLAGRPDRPAARHVDDEAQQEGRRAGRRPRRWRSARRPSSSSCPTWPTRPTVGPSPPRRRTRSAARTWRRTRFAARRLLSGAVGPHLAAASLASTPSVAALGQRLVDGHSSAARRPAVPRQQQSVVVELPDGGRAAADVLLGASRRGRRPLPVAPSGPPKRLRDLHSSPGSSSSSASPSTTSFVLRPSARSTRRPASAARSVRTSSDPTDDPSAQAGGELPPRPRFPSRWKTPRR